MTVTLAATDTGGSQVERTEYRFSDSGPFQAYTAPIRRSAGRVHDPVPLA